MQWNRVFERLEGLLPTLLLNGRPERRPLREGGRCRPALERLEDRLSPAAPGTTFDLSATVTVGNLYGLCLSQADRAGLTVVVSSEVPYMTFRTAAPGVLSQAPTPADDSAAAVEPVAQRATGVHQGGFRVLYVTNWDSNDISTFGLSRDGTLQGPPRLFPVANGAKNPLVAV